MDDDIFERIIFLADPDLNEPVLVCSLEGWIDAGGAANTAINTMLDAIDTEVLATFDTEYFIDQRARRPMARIIDGVTTELTWPEIQLRYGKDRDGADLIFLVGPEPDFHWSDFVDIVTDAAGRFDIRMVVGLGAFPAPAPHTRPTRVIGTAPAQSAHLLASVGTVNGEIEVPAGITSALELGFAEVNIDMVTLWARVPHYVASLPYPEAAAALIDGLAGTAGLSLDSSQLRRSADEARQQVEDMMGGNPDNNQMIEQLEQAVDSEASTPLGGEIPSGDELAAELEKFLRGEAS
jgi:proteasome assembly chaperone (PAC2) family protein